MRSWRVGAVSLTVAVLLASAWASGWHRFTWGARLGTLSCALAVLGVGLYWRHRQANARSSGSDGAAPLPAVNHTGAALWLVVILVAAVWDVLGLLTPPGQHHLTLSALALAYRPLHALLFACWLAIGWVLASKPMLRQGR
ncbi:MAG: hypothetical protein ACLQCU_12655 [Acidimicrobiales bacterium]